MKKKNIICLILCSILSFSLIGCNLQDDYILETKENTDEKPSDDTVNEIFESEKVSELMDKLKTTPGDVTEKLDDVDSDTEKMLRELTEKADELTDTINSADIEGRSDEIKSQMDEISDKLDDIKEKVEDTKDRVDTIENPVDKTEVTDVVDQFEIHMKNLEKVLNRLGE